MYGDQIHRQRKEGWDYPVMNRVFSDITQEVAMLSANNPRLEVLPVEDSDTEAAKVCGEVLDGYWQGPLNMRMKIMQGLYDSHLAGFYMFKWWWEPRAFWDKQTQQWQGDIRVQVVNPYYFGCDPDVESASAIATDAKFVTITRYADKAWAANRWPKYRNYLRTEKGIADAGDPYWIPGGATGGDGYRESGTLSADGGTWTGKEMREVTNETLQQRLAALVKGEPADRRPGGGESSDRLVKIEEVYWRDWSEEQVAAVHEPFSSDEDSWDFQNLYKPAGVPMIYDRDFPVENGYEVYSADRPGSRWPTVEVSPKVTRPKYPHGRITIRLDEECIVEDRPWEAERWPIAVGVNYMLPHIWQGLNGVELVREMQDYLNNISCHFLNNVKHHSDPVWLVENEQIMKKGVNQKKTLTISNAAGSIIELVKGGINRIKRQDAKDIPQSLFNLYDLFRRAAQDIDGVHDVAQGRASAKQNTLGELQMLNRNTRLRIGMQGAILDHTLQEVGRGVADLMQRKLPIGRWVRRTGEQEKRVQASLQWTQQMTDTKYDVVMVPASTLPYDEERELMKYDKAYQIAGPAMLEDYLKKLKIPNYQEIMQKHEIVGPLMQLMEMAQEAGMGPDQLIEAIQAQLQQLQQLQAEVPVGETQ